MTSDENEQVVGDLESSTTCSRIWAQIQKLENAVSAIHAQVSASYVRGCVAGEEQDRVGDFVVGAETVHGNDFKHRIMASHVDSGIEKYRTIITGGDGIRSDTIAR